MNKIGLHTHQALVQLSMPFVQNFMVRRCVPECLDARAAAIHSSADDSTHCERIYIVKATRTMGNWFTVALSKILCAPGSAPIVENVHDNSIRCCECDVASSSSEDSLHSLRTHASKHPPTESYHTIASM